MGDQQQSPQPTCYSPQPCLWVSSAHISPFINATNTNEPPPAKWLHPCYNLTITTNPDESTPRWREPTISPSPPTISPSPLTISPSPLTISPSPLTISPSPLTISPSPLTISPSPLTISPSPLTISPSPQTISPTVHHGYKIEA